jgi:2-keto-3-deoxy-L-rhamnonate aldolase RhmA
MSAFMLAPNLAAQRHSNPLIDLWLQGKPAFGIFVPNEAPRPATTSAPGAAPGSAPGGDAGAATGGTPAAPAGTPPAGAGGQRPGGGPRPKAVYTEAGGEKLAANPLYDYLFLNLEGSYDSAAVKNIAAGLRKGAGAGARKSLIVRVPAFHEDADQGRARIREVFAAGADGITFPHAQSVDEAKRIIEAARAEKINVWSPDNLKGDKLLMIMIEDPDALAQATEFANLTGYSILACGIGSLTQALGGNREAAEAGTQKILAETKRVKLPNMLTATMQDVDKRVKEGFLGILAQGQNPDEAIKIGRAAAGR